MSNVKEREALALKSFADELGCVKARIADDKAVEEELKAVFIEAAAEGPESVFEGEAFRVSVSFGSKKVVDYPAALRRLSFLYNIPKAEIDSVVDRVSKVAEGVPCVRVSARKG